MAETTLWTFRDVTEYLVDQLDVPITGRNLRLARQAALTAYRDLPNRHRWRAYERRHTLKTTADYSTGSITYDHTGGTYERMLTLATGTWPTDAAEGRVIISSVAYDVAERKSASVVTLEANNNPGADVAAGTSYTWYRSTYALPVNFRKILKVMDTDQEREIEVRLNDYTQVTRVGIFDTPNTPLFCTLISPADYYNSVSLEFTPPPTAAVTYDITYEAMPRDLLIEEYSTGTVTISAQSATVVGTDTVFPASCVGSIIRFSSSSTTAPTSVVGSPSSTVAAGVNNLFAAQRVITVRGGDTGLTLDAVVTSTLTGVKYTISDPIDMTISSMFTAFLRMAEAEYARLVSHEKFRDKWLDSRQALINAMEADSLHAYSVGTTYYDRFHHVNVTTDDA